jgi:hypothetical protein
MKLFAIELMLTNSMIIQKIPFQVLALTAFKARKTTKTEETTCSRIPLIA